MVRQFMSVEEDTEKVASSVMFSSFVDEMTKIALAPQNPLKALKVGPFSTNVGSSARSSFKMRMPTMNAAPAPPVGRVTTVGGSSIATGTPGVNLRQPAIGKQNIGRSQLAQQEQLRAGPGHIAQSTPAVPMTAQGQPSKVSTPAPTGGTLSGAATSAAPTASSGQAKTAMSEEEAALEMVKARRARFEGMEDKDLSKELWKNRVRRYGVLPTPLGLYGWYKPQARQDVKTIKEIMAQREQGTR